MHTIKDLTTYPGDIFQNRTVRLRNRHTATIARGQGAIFALGFGANAYGTGVAPSLDPTSDNFVFRNVIQAVTEDRKLGPILVAAQDVPAGEEGNFFIGTGLITLHFGTNVSVAVGDGVIAPANNALIFTSTATEATGHCGVVLEAVTGAAGVVTLARCLFYGIGVGLAP